jgi:hypothetical protein
VTSVSCGAAGYCSAGGFYQDAAFGHSQAFVVGQVNDSWGTAVEVPGTAALNKRGVGELTSVSCASSGNCSAGGSYTDSGGQAFVVREANGAWRTAVEIPGTAALNKAGVSAVGSVSCASAGNCGAGGFYKDGAGHDQAFVAGEVNGAWRTATEVPASRPSTRAAMPGSTQFRARRRMQRRRVLHRRLRPRPGVRRHPKLASPRPLPRPPSASPQTALSNPAGRRAGNITRRTS